MPLPRDKPITAGFAVREILGAWLDGRQDGGREQRQAKRAAEAAQAQNRRAAYADLVVTARPALRHWRQLYLAQPADAPGRPEVWDAFIRSRHLADALNKAVANIETTGTAEARSAAQAVHDSAKELADFYQARPLTPAAADHQAGMPCGQGLVPFDVSEAQALCDALSDAIDNFVTATQFASYWVDQ